MRRFGLVLAAAALVGAVNTAEAQLSMQMGNGWNATFSGNVNAFWIYADTDDGPKSNGIGTGLLPAFFTFDAKGKEGNTDLGVHFGFAPQVSAGGNSASFFGDQAAGAQIDMRQVYATVGGTWGTILFGKELGIYQRQNILTDMTLFGVGVQNFPGVTQPNRGTALGRIGYGYLYTDFRGQFSYSTPAGKSFGLSIGVFEPIEFGPYNYGSTPRFEAEATFNPKFGEGMGLSLFASGAVQSGKVQDEVTGATGDSETATGFAGGAKLSIKGFDIVASGFVAKGMGTIFMGDLNPGDADQGVNPDGSLQDSYGYIIQGLYTFPSKKLALGASYGGNFSDDIADGYGQTALTFQGTYFITKSVRAVAEYSLVTVGDDVADVDMNQISAGMMLFY
ncbi:MAG TPA: hypothetical protein VFY20_09840 [Gemmatimonadales bacterium]|nr:hypothetical protein [Gemmatimonadales bacterium]